MSTVKKSIYTAVFIALCVVLPLAFHGVQNAGSIFLPMHIPVLLCGLICGWPYGLLTGLAGSLLSNLLTGMPPMAYLPSMMIELAVYGLIAGLLSQYLRSGKTWLDTYVSLIAAMLAGRVVGGLMNALIFSRGGYSLPAWITSYFVTALPGIVLQLVLIPLIIFALSKARLIPARYPDAS